MFFVMIHCMDNCFLLISGLPFAIAPGYDIKVPYGHDNQNLANLT